MSIYCETGNFSCAPVGKKQNVVRKHIQRNLNKPKTDGKKEDPLNCEHYTLDKRANDLL